MSNLKYCDKCEMRYEPEFGCDCDSSVKTPPTVSSSSLATGYIAPCPFCGGEGVVETAAGDWFVTCTLCYSGSGGSDTEQEAVFAWNKRAI